MVPTVCDNEQFRAPKSILRLPTLGIEPNVSRQLDTCSSTLTGGEATPNTLQSPLGLSCWFLWYILKKFKYEYNNSLTWRLWL